MLKVVLVDDEKESLEAISKTLEIYFPNVAVINMFDDSVKALSAIPLLQPDLVFLDIEMPGMNGLELVMRLEEFKGEIIFITAYNQYALNAIKLSALDYLLKPVAPSDLEAALLKAETEIANKKRLEQFRVLSNLLYSGGDLRNGIHQKHKVALPTFDGISYVSMESIIRIEANQNYCEFYLLDSNNKPLIISRNIGIYEESLEIYHFMRIHRSHIINLKMVKEFVRQDGGYVKMVDDTSIEVSRGKRDILLERLEQI